MDKINSSRQCLAGTAIGLSRQNENRNQEYNQLSPLHSNKSTRRVDYHVHHVQNSAGLQAGDVQMTRDPFRYNDSEIQECVRCVYEQRPVQRRIHASTKEIAPALCIVSSVHKVLSGLRIRQRPDWPCRRNQGNTKPC